MIELDAVVDMTPERWMTYQFLLLPYHVRMRIIMRLRLVDGDDLKRPDVELFTLAFRRVRTKKLHEQFWNAIANEYGLLGKMANPYVKKENETEGRKDNRNVTDDSTTDQA